MTEEPKKTADNKQRPETNEIFIGDKPFMKYVIAAMMQIEEKDSAIIKARGKFISRGVDVAEVVKKRLKEKDSAEVAESIAIGTDGFKNPEGKDINVSTIEIDLKKK